MARNIDAADAHSAIELTADDSRNLIGIRFHGRVTALAMRDRLAATKQLVSKARPGFTLLSDLSDLASMDLDCVPALAELMDFLKANGVGMVVRVIPDPAKDIGLNILAITHYRRGVKVVTCETLAEAERALQP